MSEQEQNDLFEVKMAVRRIERGLFGDEAMGDEGIAKTVKDHSTRIGSLEKWRTWIAGGVAVVGVMWAVFSEFHK
jgi:hypothetical protein